MAKQKIPCKYFIYKGLKLKVIPPGLEPGTYSLEDCCSIQLSYETKSTECLNSLIK